MDLYNIAKKLSRLVPDRYNNVTQLYIYLHTNKTLQQFTNNFGYETNIRLAFFIDSVKKNIPRQYVEWSINNNLYVFDQICFSKHPGERDCDNCEGDGYIECNNCDQNNEVICDVCNGDGGDEGDCDVCNGDGYVDCDICDSVGSIDCPICDGDGLIIDIDEVPEITVSSYISYDLNTEAELQEYLSMTKEFDIMDFLSRPKLAILERTFNSTNINTSSIPKENWDKCFLNSIKDFDPAYYKPKGSINQMIMAKDYGSYDINDNLTNGS